MIRATFDRMITCREIGQTIRCANGMGVEERIVVRALVRRWWLSRSVRAMLTRGCGPIHVRARADRRPTPRDFTSERSYSVRAYITASWPARGPRIAASSDRRSLHESWNGDRPTIVARSARTRWISSVMRNDTSMAMYESAWFRSGQPDRQSRHVLLRLLQQNAAPCTSAERFGHERSGRSWPGVPSRRRRDSPDSAVVDSPVSVATHQKVDWIMERA